MRPVIDIAAEIARCPDALRGHMARTAETAARLAGRWGGRPEAAYLAGLVHDALKGVPLEIGRAWVAAVGAAVDPADLETAGLLHGPLAAEVLARSVGLGDAEVLDAVRYHTTGRAAMSPTEAALFVADQVEPGRGKAATPDLRRAAERGPDEAVRAVLAYKAAHVRKKGGPAHPRAAAAMAAYGLG